MSDPANRSDRIDRALTDLLSQAPEVEAAAVVSFDGLPMASALPASMDEDRVAAMSAALLSLGERAAEGLGRGALNQVYIEGEQGTVFLVSADDEAVLVAVASRGAKVGMMLYEVRRAADQVATALRRDDEDAAAEAVEAVEPAPVPAQHDHAASVDAAVNAAVDTVVGAVADTEPQPAEYAPVSSDADWAASSYLPNGAAATTSTGQTWS